MKGSVQKRLKFMDDSADSVAELDSSSQAEPGPSNVGKKRKRNTELWKRHQEKKLRVEGKQYSTHKTKVKPDRIGNPGRVPDFNFFCRDRCAIIVPHEHVQLFLEKFNSFPDHASQNLYLSGLCVANSPIKHKPNPTTKAREKAVKYYVEVQLNNKNVRYLVCKKALCKFLGIRQSRLRYKVLDRRSTVQKDSRGSHSNRPNKIKPEVVEVVKGFIESFPARESHYSRHDNRHKKYLESNLSVKKLHSMMLEKFPELSGVVLYDKFREIFVNNFNISFGYPRSDICDTCEMFQADISRYKKLNDEQKVKSLSVEHKLHVSKADAFYQSMNEIVADIKDDPTQIALCFDFEKNLPLPITGVGPEYYKRQLWVHNFDIHNMAESKGTMFLYSEHFAGKGPNEVISMLQWYFENKVSNEVKIVYLFADNCFSQNKNRFLWSYLAYLIEINRFTQINFLYPIPGHSRMPCDRDFAAIEKYRKSITKVSVPSEWVQLVKTSRKKNPFSVVFVEHPLTDSLLNPENVPVVKVKDFKAAVQPVLVNSIKNLRKFRGLIFTKDGILGRHTMTGLPTVAVQVKKPAQKKSSLKRVFQNAQNAFADYLPIKPAKYSDVKFLLQRVVLDESVCFYDTLKPSEFASDEAEIDKE